MKIREIQSFLQEDARVFWADRVAKAHSDILEAQVKLGAMGMSGGSPLTNKLQAACESALDDLLLSYLQATRRALEAFRPPLTKKLRNVLWETLSEALTARRIQLNALLAKSVQSGSSEAHPTIDVRARLLAERGRNELNVILAHHESWLKSTLKPWFDRPLGRVALAVVAAVLGALAFALVKSRLGW